MKMRSFREFVTGISSKAPWNAFGTKKNRVIVLKTAEPAPLQKGETRNWSGIIEGLFFVFGLLAFASLVLGYFAYTRPLWRTVSDDVSYQQTGVFSYSAVVPEGVYDSRKLNTGEPVFSKLTCFLNLQFDYALAGDDLQEITGTHQLTAQIIETNSGWQRTIRLEPESPFRGNTFTTLNMINLCQVEKIVAAMEQKTEFQSIFYSLVITPSVTVTGKVYGRELQDVFDPRLVLQFDQVHFFLARTDPLLGDPLNPSETGILAGFRTEPNTLPLLGKELLITHLRNYAKYGLVVSLAGILLLVSVISIVMSRSKQSLVKLKYSAMLVDINDRTLELSSPAIDVVTIDDLAKLAERHNSLILHETHGMTHHYLVQGDRITYRFILDETGGTLTEVLSMKELEDNLQKGIERGEFQVYYQPIVSLADGKITTVEALLRWKHPERGLISAAEFISVADSTGLIDKIGDWMLESACTQAKNWQRAGLQITLAINLSEYQLERDPAESISRVLRKTGVDPRTLQIEISEANIMKNITTVLPSLQKLTDLGIQLAVDNIAGQSSLSALEPFPINSIKIDRLVIEKICNAEDANAVGAMITEGISLGMNVVAEGVETEEQLEFLRSHQCNLAQGYLLGRPAPADEVTLLLEKGRNPGRPRPARRRSRSKEDAG
jgi:EAL domain-containing protein (putative c-di-GMP-specific phosphodiesterase class I)